MVIVAVIVAGAFIGLNNTLVTTAVMSIAPVERPVASATYGFVRFIGGGLAPFVAGLLVTRFNAHVPFLLGTGTLLAAAVVLSTVHGASPPPTPVRSPSPNSTNWTRSRTPTLSPKPPRSATPTDVATSRDGPRQSRRIRRASTPGQHAGGGQVLVQNAIQRSGTTRRRGDRGHRQAESCPDRRSDIAGWAPPSVTACGGPDG